MKLSHVGTWMVVALLFGSAADARAGHMCYGGFGGFGGIGGVGFTGSGGFPGVGGGIGLPPIGKPGPFPPGFTGGTGMCGFSGFTGMGGCCGGGIMGTPGCGASMTGFCGFSGCIGGMPQTEQSYSKWSPSPGQAYYYRTLQIKTPPPSQSALELVMVHYPDRPKFFYFYDPVDKKYFGRFILGAKPEQCFSLLPHASRKAGLKEIPEGAFAGVTNMPTIPHVIRPRPGTTVDPALQNITIMRPPESVPDDLLGLPPEESLLKKK